MKQLGRAAVRLSFSIWFLSAACSLAVDPQRLQQGCGEGTKPCEVTPGELRCVSTADPEYGCARESCVPCTLSNAVEVCGGDGECTVATCEPDFDNCDRSPKNGCEVALDSSYENCGSCGVRCEDALRTMDEVRASECDGGRCVITECKAGFFDCDGAATNGCEAVKVCE